MRRDGPSVGVAADLTLEGILALSAAVLALCVEGLRRPSDRAEDAQKTNRMPDFFYLRHSACCRSHRPPRVASPAARRAKRPPPSAFTADAAAGEAALPTAPFFMLAAGEAQPHGTFILVLLAVDLSAGMPHLSAPIPASGVSFDAKPSTSRAPHHESQLDAAPQASQRSCLMRA